MFSFTAMYMSMAMAMAFPLFAEQGHLCRLVRRFCFNLLPIQLANKLFILC